MVVFIFLSPTKSTFIKAKYQRLAFVPRLPCKDDDTITVSDLSQVSCSVFRKQYSLLSTS